MSPNDYQKFVISLLSPESKEDQLVNAALGLAGESGEFADMVKKHKHHNHEFDVLKGKLELGDILFYLSSAANKLGATLDEIIMLNVEKLTERYPKGRFDTEDSKIKADQMKDEWFSQFKTMNSDAFDKDGSND